jgi:M6 family metalloprotease-like protein
MSRRTTLLSILTALMLGLVMALPAAAAVRPIELVGTLELLHGEDFTTGEATYDYHLQTAKERVQVKFRAGHAAPDGFVNGAVVQIRGHRDGAIFAAADGATGGTVLQSAPGWSGPRKLAVILMNFSNNATKPFTASFANGVVFTNSNSVRAYYAEQSFGAMVLQGTTFDWVKVPYASTSCQTSAWASAAKAAVAARGVDLSSYTNFMFIFPHTTACSWGGLGHLPGTSTWINGTPSLRIPAHELGHNLGTHHASSLRCTTAGVRVALSSTCTKSEYGDPFTIMGNAATRHLSNLSLIQIGYLPESATRTVVATGTYALVKAEHTSGVRILAIPRGDGTTLYLEYRRPSGTYFDNFSSTNPVVKGVTIRIAKGFSTITQTLLVDTVPSTTTFLDAPLRLYKTFTDYLSGVKVYVTALTTSTASVIVIMPGDVTAPSAPGGLAANATSPSAIHLSWTAATDNRAVAGYRIWRNGALVTTTPATSRSFDDTALAGGTTSSYSVRAVDGAGNLSAAATASATTPQPDAAPSPPGSLAATTTATSAHLTWTAASDNVGVVGYRVSRNGGTPVATTSLSLTQTGLTAETAYTWSVRAVDTAGQLGAAATVTASTTFIDGTAPSAPVAAIARANPQWADLSWSAATDNVRVTGYEVYRSGALYATLGSSERTARVPSDGTYTVSAVDAEGNRSPQSRPVGL